MTNKSIETRVFICLIIILIFLTCTGCRTVHHKWIWDHKPDDKPSMIGPANEHDRDVGGIKVNVLEIRF